MDAPTAYRSRLFPAVAVAVIAAALGSCSSVTGPNNVTDPPPPDSVRLFLYSLTSPATCEDPFTGLDGGEFIWQVSVTWPDGSSQVISQTSNYPAPNAYKTMRQDQPRIIDQEATRVMHSTPGDALTVTVRVSEIDFDLFGNNPTPDSRMNDLQGQTVIHFYETGGWPLGQYTTWVKNGAACQFRADFGLLAPTFQ